MITFTPAPGNLNTYSLFESFTETVNVESDLGTVTLIEVTPDVTDANVTISTDNETFFTIAGSYITILGGFNFQYIIRGFSDKNSTPVTESVPASIPLNADIFKYNPATLQQRTVTYSVYVEVGVTESDTQLFDIIIFNNWDVGRDILSGLLAARV